MPLLEMASLIDEFNVGPLTITRRGIPTRNSYGEMVAAASAAVVLPVVAVHNASGKDRAMLPVAIRDNETIEVYSKVQIYSGNDGQASDQLSYLSRNWVCVQTLDYNLNGGVFISFFQLEDTNQ
jgi:hypothetical protein